MEGEQVGYFPLLPHCPCLSSRWNSAFFWACPPLFFLLWPSVGLIRTEFACGGGHSRLTHNCAFSPQTVGQSVQRLFHRPRSWDSNFNFSLYLKPLFPTLCQCLLSKEAIFSDTSDLDQPFPALCRESGVFPRGVKAGNPGHFSSISAQGLP